MAKVVDGTLEVILGTGENIHMCFPEVLRGYVSRRFLNWYGCVDD